MLLTERALLYRKENQTELAFVDIDRALQLESNNATTRTQRAFINNERGEHDLADADFEMALELQPDNNWILGWQATGLHNRGDPGGALAVYDQMLVIAPQDAAYLHRKGHVLEGLGRTEDAIATYEAAISAQPDSYMGYQHLADIYEERQDLDAKLGVYRRAAFVWPGSQNIDINISRIYLRQNDYDAVFAQFRNPDGSGYQSHGWPYLAAAHFGIGEDERGKEYVAQYVDLQFEEDDEPWEMWLIDTIGSNGNFRHQITAIVYAHIGQIDLALEEMERLAEGGGLMTMRVLRNTLSKEGFYDGAKSGPYDETVSAAMIAYLESMNEIDR
jgi:tetratricopeptide (TPR) repeat protein